MAFLSQTQSRVCHSPTNPTHEGCTLHVPWNSFCDGGEWMNLAEVVELYFRIYETGDEVIIKNLNIACVYVPFS